MINRITPEMVLAAYEKTGLAPVRGVWLEKQPTRECACALSATALATDLNAKEEIQKSLTVGLSITARSVREILSDVLHLDRDYLDGFVVGFDDPTYSGFHSQEAYFTGFEDGKVAGEAVTAKYGYEHFN